MTWLKTNPFVSYLPQSIVHCFVTWYLHISNPSSSPKLYNKILSHMKMEKKDHFVPSSSINFNEQHIHLMLPIFTWISFRNIFNIELQSDEIHNFRLISLRILLNFYNFILCNLYKELSFCHAKSLSRWFRMESIKWLIWFSLVAWL